MLIVNRYLKEVLVELRGSPKSEKLNVVKPLTVGRGYPDTLALRMSFLKDVVPPPMQIVNKYLKEVYAELRGSPKSENVKVVKSLTVGRGYPDSLALKMSFLKHVVPPPDHLKPAIEAVGRWSCTTSFNGTIHRCIKINRNCINKELLSSFDDCKNKHQMTPPLPGH